MRLLSTLLLVFSIATLSAQVTDNFTDGDFTRNPVWAGDTVEWEVLNGELHLNNPAPASNNNSYLSTPSVAFNNATWEFRVRLDFNPSSTNYVEVFLASDIADLEGNTNGYFVKLGGTTDEVSLFESDSGSDTEIIDGMDTRLDVTNSTVYVRVTRDAAGNWELFSDTSGTGNNLFYEGAVTDTKHSSSSFFGIHSRYTSTRATWCYLDTVHVTFIQAQDTTPPVLVSATATDTNELLLDFNENVDIFTGTSTANYFLNGITNPATAVIDPADSSLVRLGFTGSGFQVCTSQSIDISNVEDRAGNAMLSVTQPFTYAVAVTTSYKGVIINEIFADPSPQIGLPNQEFVELYNRGPTVADLNGWTISDGGTPVIIVSSGYLLCPGEYVILADSGSLWSSYGPVIEMGLPGLNNGGDALGLRDSATNPIDSVTYDLSWYGGLPWENGGYSLELINPEDTCSLSGNWRASNDPSGGTPGKQNSVLGTFTDTDAPEVSQAQLQAVSIVRLIFSEIMDLATLLDHRAYTIDQGIGNPILASAVPEDPYAIDLLISGTFEENIIYCINVRNVKDCAGNFIDSHNSVCFGIPLAAEQGDVVINEILFNPYTGGSDFVELYNLSDKIIDLNTIYIGEIFEGTDSIFNEDRVANTQLLLLPESYICLTPDRQVQIDYYLPTDPGAIYEMSSFPSYDDSEGECVIRTDSGVVLDRFFYLDDYQFPNLSDKNGVSLERHDFNRPTQDEDNWHSAASTVRYATPGYKNSQTLVAAPGELEVWLEPETFSPDQDGIDDVVSINYLFQSSGWNTRVTVFDSKGRPVKQLQQNTLLGTEKGAFTWDGTDDNLNKVKVGIYVILVEASNPNTGETQNFKLGVVVAARLKN